jgi:hypothetical protein
MNWMRWLKVLLIKRADKLRKPYLLADTEHKLVKSGNQVFKNILIMGLIRGIYFCIDEKVEYFAFGTYGLIMYYAKQLDLANGKRFFDSTLTEFYYKLNYNLDTGSLTDSDDTARYDGGELQQVINFIGNQLIPSINNEQTNLLLKYGGEHNFLNFFYTNMEYLEAMDLLEGQEDYDDNPAQLAFRLNQFNSFLQYAFSQNRAYTIFIN